MVYLFGFVGPWTVLQDDIDIELQSELLKCVKAAVDHKAGVEAVIQDRALVPSLCLNLASEDVYIATQVGVRGARIACAVLARTVCPLGPLAG